MIYDANRDVCQFTKRTKTFGLQSSRLCFLIVIELCVRGQPKTVFCVFICETSHLPRNTGTGSRTLITKK
jgi:hypothetical protein